MKTYNVTLTPNRSNPRRYVRLVIYKRGTDEQGDYVVPLRITDGKVEQLQFRDIRPYPADLEFAEAWSEHVHAQAPALPLG